MPGIPNTHPLCTAFQGTSPSATPAPERASRTPTPAARPSRALSRPRSRLLPGHRERPPPLHGFPRDYPVRDPGSGPGIANAHPSCTAVQGTIPSATPAPERASGTPTPAARRSRALPRLRSLLHAGHRERPPPLHGLPGHYPVRDPGSGPGIANAHPLCTAFQGTIPSATPAPDRASRTPIPAVRLSRALSRPRPRPIIPSYSQKTARAGGQRSDGGAEQRNIQRLWQKSTK